MAPISLYIHIPFCKSKCYYCDFLSFSKQEALIDPYVNALIEEIKTYAKMINNRETISIFFGGGTPSLLSVQHVSRIMAVITQLCKLSSDAEITIECNPESLSEDKMKGYKEAGINRVSMGLQATQNNALKQLGRIHSFETFCKKYNKLRAFGYDNINIDLMFGLPDQTIEDWHDTINRVMTLQSEHLSIYGLHIEENTPFYTANKEEKFILPDEEAERTMYWTANQLLTTHGYHHYEISNYSKAGYESEHNKVYWTLGEYIGLGLGASSYFQDYRLENTKDLKAYIEANGNLEKLISIKQKSSEVNKIEEWVFLGLRLINGIEKLAFKQHFNQSFDKIYESQIEKLLKEGLVQVDDDRVWLTSKGIDISNYVFSHFIL